MILDYNMDGDYMAISSSTSLSDLKTLKQNVDDLELDAAKSADLIMFLISDDGVQTEEAKHLANLLAIGKPVLGLINIKVGIADEPRPMDIKRIARKMSETERIEDICNQFRAYSNEYKQDWSQLTFVHTHLKAAYVGQGKNEELWALSNFEAVQEYLLEKVEKESKKYLI